MQAIDRVMAAYAKVHKPTEEQAAMAREELSRFIDQLLSGGCREALKIKQGHPRIQTRTRGVK
jgi:hypothetical protein